MRETTGGARFLMTIERLLTWPKLAEIVPYSRQHVQRLEQAGQFPQRLQLGPGRVAWRASEIEDWIETRQRGTLPQTPNAARR
jgi:prophage regulatory protein